MPDTSVRSDLARLAYEAFYAALGAAHVTLPWTRQRPQVQQAWRVVVETVREGDTQKGGDVSVPER